MNDGGGYGEITRILVALDPCTPNQSALERAATLAEQLHAELLALFVEDLNLINLAGLPFATEVAYSSGNVRRLDSVRMTHALRGRAERTRRDLERIGAQRQIRTSFRVVRGEFVREALSALSGMEMSILFLAARPPLAAPNAAHPARWVVRRPAGRVHPVWVSFDGSEGAARALALTRLLTAPRQADLIVALPPRAPDVLQALRRSAMAVLGEYGENARFKRLASGELTALHDAIRQEPASFLLIGRGDPRLAERNGQRFLKAVDCPVVLVS